MSLIIIIIIIIIITKEYVITDQTEAMLVTVRQRHVTCRYHVTKKTTRRHYLCTVLHLHVK